ncbi:hypothetical protein [Actinomadura litoris]|uniref:hypothetical protein n=1 Tax=Actinomadura litoris TaxID=2678616 RepID=UPI001FA6CFC2|nr:hypothetical protein [Actinomadura litoris]
MTDYSPTSIGVDGTQHTFNAAASGDKVTASGAGVFLTVKNGSGSPVTLTIAPYGNTGYNVANPQKTFSIAATNEKDIPLLRDYADPTDGYKVALAWSSTTSVTWAVKRLGVL